MDEIQGIIHPGAQFFSICGLSKLENKLSAPKYTGGTNIG